MTTIADLRDAQTASQQDAQRDAQGRFLPGQSGNPAGRPRGARNRRTVLAEALAEGEAAAIARQVIDKALAGDGVAARFCLDRLCPKPRGRAIELDLPEDLSAGGAVVAAFNAALKAMAAGEITPEEAVTVARFLEGRQKTLEAWQLERKLTWSPTAPPIPGDGGDKEEDDEASGELAASKAPRQGPSPGPLPASGERVPTRQGDAFFSLSPLQRGEGRGEGPALPRFAPHGEEVRALREAASRLHSACILPPGGAPPGATA